MTATELQELLIDTGAWRRGHFLLTSGRHSDEFFLFSQVFQHPTAAERIGRTLAARFVGQGIETVVGPAMGGVILAHEVARALGARALYTEKAEGGMVLKRGFTLRNGEGVLLVEDAMTTGGSLQQALEAIRPSGCTLLGIGVVVDRSGGAVSWPVPVTSLWQSAAASYEAAKCPLCQAGVPLTRPKDSF